MAGCVGVLTKGLLAPSVSPATLGELEPADAFLLQMLLTVTATSPLAVAALYETGAVPLLSKLMLAPAATTQVNVVSGLYALASLAESSSLSWNVC